MAGQGVTIEDDVRGATLTLDRCQAIAITHPDEAALGRIFKHLMVLAGARYPAHPVTITPFSARLVSAALASIWSAPIGPAAQAIGLTDEAALHVVRALLAEMRVPDEAMLEAGREHFGGALFVWRDMIDAARGQ